MTSSVADAVVELSGKFSGQLLQRTDAGYDDARRVHNGLIDKRPALIARCRSTADIVEAVKFARTRGLEVAVRGGGHNVAGRATVDDGLMIDLAQVDERRDGPSSGRSARPYRAGRRRRHVGRAHYWKSSFLAKLSDEAIDAMIDAFGNSARRCPTPMGAMLLEHFHGAATRVKPTDTAFPHRTDGYNLLVLGQWMDPVHNETCIGWARKSYADLERFMAPGRYVNYLGDDETGDPVAAAYGLNLRRLQELKKKYDPENFFHLNPNIRPA